jgi:hypothetical protein
MATTKKASQTPRPARKAVRTTRTSSTSQTSTMVPSPLSMSIDTAGLRKNNIVKVLILGLILAALFYARGFFVVAIVNGQPITRYAVVSELEKQAGKGTTDALISKKLVRMEAEKKGIKIEQSAVDAHIKEIEKDLKSSGQSFEELLKAQGITRAQVEEQTELQLMLKKLLKEKTAVKDSEVEAAFEEQKSSMPEGMSDEAFKEQLRASLEEQKFAFEAQTYIQELQNNAKITYWHNY